MLTRIADTSARRETAISETWLPRGEFVTRLLTAGVGQTVRYQTGQYLYQQGDIDQRFYILVRGKVHVSNLSANGHESTFNIMGAGSLIGEAAALTGLPRYSAARVHIWKTTCVNIRALPWRCSTCWD